MIDNTQEPRDLIQICTNIYYECGTIKRLDELTDEALDWHNKLVIAELEELLGQQDHEGHLVEPTSNSVRDRINKLKESKRL